MKIKYVLNNYMIGAKLKSAPLEKLILKERIDNKKTLVVFELTESQRAFCDRLFAKAGQAVTDKQEVED